jgi:hypothetical protein
LIEVRSRTLSGGWVIGWLLDSLGYDTVDAGPLAENWRTQRESPVYVTPYGTYGELPGTPASAQAVREALAEPKPTAA